MRGHPAKKARKLGASVALVQPGSASNVVGKYRALSGAGFGGGHTGHTGQAGQIKACSAGGFEGACVQATTSRISARRHMWVIYLEIAVALALVVLIVWWTWPKKPPQ